MSIAMVVNKECKRYVAWEASSKVEHCKEYGSLVELLSDLQSDVFKYNILDTLNQEWLLAKDI